MSRRFSYEFVKNYIEVESQSGCTLLTSDYLGINFPLELRCACGFEFSTTFAYFKRKEKPKKQCDECGFKITIKKRTFTYEHVKEVIEKDTGCTLISKEYIGSGKKLEILCGCGEVFSVTFSRFFDKKKPQNCCNNCAKKRRDGIRVKNVINFVEIESKSNCSVLDVELKDRSIGLKLVCSCGDVFMTNFNRFKNQNQRICRGCRRDNERDDYLVSFIKNVQNLGEGEYTVLGDFVDTKTKIEILHKKCNNKYFVVPSNFISGNRCPFCDKSRPKTEKSFKRDVYSLVGNEYVVIGKYQTMAHKIAIRHNICENVFNMESNAFLNGGQRCPICNESKGEQAIRRHLSGIDINFVKEYTFKNLLSDKGNTLRFDFAILGDSGVAVVIEYDGEFHFKKQYEGHDFETQQIHDKRKNQYCKDNNIPLVRIPYWQFDKIEVILDKWLNTYNLI